MLKVGEVYKLQEEIMALDLELGFHAYIPIHSIVLVIEFEKIEQHQFDLFTTIFLYEGKKYKKRIYPFRLNQFKRCV